MTSNKKQKKRIKELEEDRNTLQRVYHIMDRYLYQKIDAEACVRELFKELYPSSWDPMLDREEPKDATPEQ